MTRINLVLAWALLAAVCTLLIFKTNFNSDLLFLDSLMADLFQSGGQWSHWKITPAPAYVPDMLAYALAYFIFPAPAQRIIFVCLLQALLLAWTCIYLGRVIRPALSTTAKTFIIVILSGVVVVASHSAMWLFFNSTNNHFGALLFPLLCTAFILEYSQSKKWLTAVLIVASTVAGTASTPVYTLAFTLPAVVFSLGAGAMLLRTQRHLAFTVMQVAALLIIGHLLAGGLSKLLIAFDALGGRAPLTASAALNSLHKFASASARTLAADNPYTFSLVVFIFIASMWLLVDFLVGVRRSLNAVAAGSQRSIIDRLGMLDSGWKHRLLVLFLCVALPINVLGAVASGGFADDFGYRYFTFPLTLAVLLWLLVVDARFQFKGAQSAGLVCLSILAVACVAGAGTAPLIAQSGRATFSEALASGRVMPSDAIGACIDHEAQNGFAFNAGIADFWNARAVMERTRQARFILNVTSNISPFFHMMSLGPLINPKQYGIESYNFVVMGNSGIKTQFDMTPEVAGQHLPAPGKIVACPQSDTQLWLYSDGSLDRTVRKNVDRFLAQNGLLQNYAFLASDLPGITGRVVDTTRVAHAPDDAAGALSFGPYTSVPVGRYTATISYQATDAGNKWDAGIFEGPSLAAGEIPVGAGDIKFDFEAKKTISKLEIRTWFGGQGTLTVNSITIRPAGSPAESSR